MEIVKRLRPSSRFDFSNASIGNLFLTGARIFTGSLESAMYLLSSICNVPPSISVLPAINTSFSHHISAVLADGTIIAGQNNISHPSTNHDAAVPGYAYDDPPFATDESYTVEDANLPGTLPTLRTSQINFSKGPITSRNSQLPPGTTATGISSQSATAIDTLPSRISRLFYISPYGMQIRLDANPRVLSALSSASAIVYSIGSLYTSLIPSLILRGVGAAIASTPSIRSKILILNGSNDRETTSSSLAPAGGVVAGFTALDFVQAVADACCQSQGRSGPCPPLQLRHYVTHVLYLEAPRAPRVDRSALGAVGIEAVRTYGRDDGSGEVRYDGGALSGALGVVLGSGQGARRGVGGWGEMSRRNTLDGSGGMARSPR